MKQQQSLGSNNQRQGLPENREEQPVSGNTKENWRTTEPEKPAITDDYGNIKNKNKDAGNGYDEKKVTEPNANPDTKENSPAKAPPPAQSKETEKTYGEETAESGKHHHMEHTAWPQQSEQGEKAENDKRRLQSDDAGW